MQRYVKNLFDFSRPNSIPEFDLQIEEFNCSYCRSRIEVAVPSTAVDWERIANDYKNYSKEMWQECNLLLSEAGVDTLLTSKLKQILERCKKALDKAEPS